MQALIPASSPRAKRAVVMVETLQHHFASQLQEVARSFGDQKAFERIEWLRDEGRHGGGSRLGIAETTVFNCATINVSSVHYDDLQERKLSSATALSTIIHPQHPRVPSVHMHFSFTELRNGEGSWRLMADLNPAITNDDEANAYRAMLQEVAPEQFDEASEQGERYFNIPALERHRGVVHFYLEGYFSPSFDADLAFTQKVATTAIEHYVALLGRSLERAGAVAPSDAQAQLAYHSLYLLQVLTLDRGTTSGVLIHDQNDEGILGSLPSFVDRALLLSWVPRLPAPQDSLLRQIVSILPEQTPCPVSIASRRALAALLREHYTAHPEALALQASGNMIPPTVSNHLPVASD